MVFLYMLMLMVIAFDVDDDHLMLMMIAFDADVDHGLGTVIVMWSLADKEQ